MAMRYESKWEKISDITSYFSRACTVVGLGLCAVPLHAAQLNPELIPGASTSVFSRFGQTGPLATFILLLLVFISVATWTLALAKFWYLRRLEKSSLTFLHGFNRGGSLDDISRNLVDYAYSPLREVFRSAYRELARTKGLDVAHADQRHAAIVVDTVARSVHKARLTERRSMERYLSLLAISASVSPFIGLFGTVWGIIAAFEGIAAAGNASLAAVAPGISEALIATAYGLAAAIPAAIGYNLANSKIRTLLTHIDSFATDLLNIVEEGAMFPQRYGSEQQTTTAAPLARGGE